MGLSGNKVSLLEVNCDCNKHSMIVHMAKYLCFCHTPGHLQFSCLAIVLTEINLNNKTFIRNTVGSSGSKVWLPHIAYFSYEMLLFVLDWYYSLISKNYHKSSSHIFLSYISIVVIQLLSNTSLGD